MWHAFTGKRAISHVYQSPSTCYIWPQKNPSTLLKTRKESCQSFIDEDMVHLLEMYCYNRDTCTVPHLVWTCLHRLTRQHSYFKKGKEDTAEENKAKASPASRVRLIGSVSAYLEFYALINNNKWHRRAIWYSERSKTILNDYFLYKIASSKSKMDKLSPGCCRQFN